MGIIGIGHYNIRNTVEVPFLHPFFVGTFFVGTFFARFLLVRKSKKKDTHGFQKEKWRKFRIKTFLFGSFSYKREIYVLIFCFYFRIFYVLNLKMSKVMQKRVPHCILVLKKPNYDPWFLLRRFNTYLLMSVKLTGTISMPCFLASWPIPW